MVCPCNVVGALSLTTAEAPTAESLAFVTSESLVFVTMFQDPVTGDPAGDPVALWGLYLIDNAPKSSPTAPPTLQGQTISSWKTFPRSSDPLTVSAMRFLLPTVALIVWLRIRGLPLHLPARDGWIAAVLGAVTAFYTWALLSAIGAIPLALAILVFYLFPLVATRHPRRLWLGEAAPTDDRGDRTRICRPRARTRPTQWQSRF
jgi:hypothetical protein